MKIIFIILGIILLLAAVVVMLPVRVVIEYTGKTMFKVYVYGIKIFDTTKNKKGKQTTKSESAEKSTKSDTDYITLLKDNFELLKEILKQIVEKAKKYVIIKNIEVKYRFGLGDAAITGIYSGAVYAVINGFAAYIRNFYRIRKQRLEVVPDFDNKVQKFEAKIEIVIRAIFFVPVFIKLLRIFKRKEVV